MHPWSTRDRSGKPLPTFISATVNSALAIRLRRTPRPGNGAARTRLRHHRSASETVHEAVTPAAMPSTDQRPPAAWRRPPWPVVQLALEDSEPRRARGTRTSGRTLDSGPQAARTQETDRVPCRSSRHIRRRGASSSLSSDGRSGTLAATAWVGQPRWVGQPPPRARDHHDGPHCPVRGPLVVSNPAHTGGHVPCRPDLVLRALHNSFTCSG